MQLLLPNTLTLRTKIAVLSFYQQKIPHFFEKLCLLLEYAQIISLTVILYYNSSNLESLDSNSSAISLLKIFCPGYLIQFQEYNNEEVVFWFIFILTCLFLKYSFLIYSISMVMKGFKLNIVLTKVWGMLFLTQGRVLFLMSSSVCIKIVQAANNNKFNAPGLYYPIIIISLLFIVLEYALSLGQRLLLPCCLPNKQFLASKTNIAEIITLTQKTLLLFSDLFLSAGPLIADWIITAINMVSTFSRDFYYFKSCPPYRVNAYYFQGLLLGIVTSLSICCLLKSIVNSFSEDKFSFEFIFVIWLTITPVVAILCYLHINKTIFSMIGQPLIKSPMMMIQKINVIKSIRNSRKQLAPNSKKSNFIYFLYQSLNSNIHEVLGISQHQVLTRHQDFNLDNKEQANQHFLAYLEIIGSKFSRSQMIKLYIAYYYGIKLKLYTIALKLLRDLEQNCSSNIGFNIALLKYQIQKSMKSVEKNTETSLDLLEYFTCYKIVENFKQLMVNQADVQLKLCQECKHKRPDLAKILDYSQKIDIIRSNISKSSENLFKRIPSYYLEPRLIYAHYSLKLNFSLRKFNSHSEFFSDRLNRHQVFRDMNRLCQQNMYDENKILFILAIQKDNIGSIAYCSRSVEKILGWDAKELIGRSVSGFLPPLLASCYIERLKKSIESNDKPIFKEIFRSFVIAKDGYLRLMDFYIDFHPFISNGVYLDLVLRPVNTSSQHLLVDKNGLIQSTSESLAHKLGLSWNSHKNLELNIVGLSQELNQINKACDIIAHLKYHGKIKVEEQLERDEYIDLGKQKSQRNSAINKVLEMHISHQNLASTNAMIFMSPDQALSLYEKVQSQGHILTLHSLKSQENNVKKAFNYLCKAKLKFYPSNYIKVFSFDEVRDGSVFSKHMQAANQTQTDSTTIKPNLQIFTAMRNEFQDSNQITEFSKSEVKTPMTTCEEAPLRPLNLEKTLITKECQTHTLEITPKCELKNTKMVAFADDKKDMNQTNSPKKSMNLNKEKLDNEVENKKDNAKIPKIQISIGSQRSKMSGQRKVENEFDIALNLKYYLKTHNVFFFIFYLIMLLLFVDNLIVQLISSSSLETLGRRSDIVDSAESMNDLFIRVQRNLITILDFEKNKLSEPYFASYNSSRKSLINRIADDLNIINAANRKLILTAGTLDKDDRDKIMENSIILFQNYYDEPMEPPLLLNTFQSTIKLYEAGLKGTAVARINVSKSYENYKIILRNVLNNYLINAERVSDLFLSVSEKETNVIMSTLLINLIIILTSLTLLLIISYILIIGQCKLDVQNLSAFVKLDPAETSLVATQINKFKNILQTEIYFENLSISEIPDYFGKFIKGAVKSNSKNRDLEPPNYTFIHRRYFLLILQTTLVLGLIGGLCVVAYFQKTDAFEFVYTKLAQIHFMRRTNSKINIAVTSFFEIYSGNNETLLMNEPSAIYFGYAISNIKRTASQISDKFKISELESDYNIQKVLYTDGCQFLKEQNLIDRCLVARKGRNNTSFMMLLGDLEMGLETANYRFFQSNRATQELSKIMQEEYPGIIIPLRTLSDLGKFIATSLGEAYQDNILKTLNEQKIFDVIMAIVLVVMSLVIWFSIFRKIREANNNFKKVLKTLPISIVMSSFMLKAYILKSSRDALTFIRNDI